MKIEKLRNNHKKEIIIGTVLTVVIGGALTFRLTHSKYRVTQSIDLGSGVINYKPYDFKIMAMYKSDGSGDISIDSMPTSGYVINEEKTYCRTSSGNEVKGKIKTVNGIHGISGLNKGDKCYLYFDKKTSIDNVDDLIAKVQSEAKTTTPDFSKTATDDEGVFETTDGMYDNGKTYYWRGAATTNHVIFAGFCWRIVRINGDKTTRLIYNGPIIDSNKCTGNGANADAVIMGSSDSEKYYATSDGQYNNPSYVGWKYQLSSPRPTSTTSGIDSNAKVQTQKWYDINIGNNSTYSAKVAKGKFCNDREIGSGSWTTSNTTFFYAGFTRLNTNKAPTFNCNNVNDVYTLEVGAITADEVAFAGGVYGQNNVSYYLKGDNTYWTMSPYFWNGVNASVFVVGSYGYLSYTNLNNTYGLRPVINLKADTTFASGGTGTQSNPYVVQ